MKNEKARESIKKKVVFRNKRKNICGYCGCTNPMIMTIDHKVPKVRGGSEEDTNKQICCIVCNHLKGSLTHDEYKEYYKSLITLHALCKVRMELSAFKIVFKPDHYPSIKIGEKQK